MPAAIFAMRIPARLLLVSSRHPPTTAIEGDGAEEVGCEVAWDATEVTSATALGSSLALAKREPPMTIAPTDTKVPNVRRLSTLRTLLDALSLSAICIHSDFSGFGSSVIGDPFR